MSGNGSDERPLSGGLFRRWGFGRGGISMSFGVFEEIFGPTRHEARIEMEEQKRVGKPAPSPGDPPDLIALSEPGTPEPAQPGQRFTGKVLITRPEPDE